MTQTKCSHCQAALLSGGQCSDVGCQVVSEVIAEGRAVDAYIATLRNASGNSMSRSNDLIVACNYCRSPIGQACALNGPVNSGTSFKPHKVRRGDAKRLREKGEIRGEAGWTKVAV